MSATITVDHLIVGAGPVGLTTARLLANGGRSTLVVERRDGQQHHPAAHVINARTLEIFRQAGYDSGAIDAIAKDPVDAGHVNFVTRLNGELIGRLPFERQGDDCLADTPTPLRNISQHRLEPLLVDAVVGADGVELRHRTEWESCTQDADGVTSIVRDLDTGERTEVRSRYLLAADGASSRVRKSLGIDMVGPATLQSFIAIHIGANLRRLVAGRPGVLHFVMDPAVNGTFVAHDLDREWVFMTSFDPTEESVEDYSPDRCADLVRAAAGDQTIDLEVLGVGSWHMSAQVASRMRDGRVFLVGDAAHRFPPTGGLGLNTGVADAHGLVWKLLAVEDGWADPSILDTYEAERQPVAGLNCEQSTTNAFKILSLIESLGLTVSPTTERLHATLADPGAAEQIAAAVADQTTHFDMIGLQLGHVYAEGALARDDAPPPPLEDPSRFEPDACIGSRLPHGWLDDGRSTLDLISADGLTLLTVGPSDAWSTALDRITEAVPIHLVTLGDGRSDLVDDGWRSRCRLADGGALLVRPDQHIAWRTEHTEPASVDGLANALTRILGR